MFYNLPQSQICRLQRLQNAAARLILRKRKFDSARECLKELHWLPVHRRVEFKIALFVYKSHLENELLAMQHQKFGTVYQKT